MALSIQADGSRIEPRTPSLLIESRFMIAQDGGPRDEELYALQQGLQSTLRELLANTAKLINDQIMDSRAKSLALTALEEALMWSGKAIFQSEVVG